MPNSGLPEKEIRPIRQIRPMLPMISKPQLILIHQSATRWQLSREEYVEALMESTGCASCKEFTNQGQFERAMAALEKAAAIKDTWRPLRQGDRPDYWRARLASKGGGQTVDGEGLASSAQRKEMNDALAELATLHPRLRGDPEACFRYLVKIMESVTRGKCILQSALTVTQARAVIAGLKRSLASWQKKQQPENERLAA